VREVIVKLLNPTLTQALIAARGPSVDGAD